MEDAMINLAKDLAAHANIQATVQESLQGGLITGLCTVAGGVFGGRTGLLLGGALGTFSVSVTAAKDFKSVVVIIRDEMKPSEKRKLANSMYNILLKAIPVPFTTYKILKNEYIRSKIIALIIDTIRKMGYTVVN